MCLYEKFPTRLNYLGTKLAKRDLAKRDLKILEVHNYVPFMLMHACKAEYAEAYMQARAFKQWRRQGGGGAIAPPQTRPPPPPPRK